MNKAGIANRLSKVGLRDAAEAYREEVRIRRKASGEDREVASLGAWQEMWDAFRPTCERLEGESKKAKAEEGGPKPEPPAPQLPGLPANVDSVLDPAYSERDPGKQLRDGLLWPVFEWLRVIRDTDDGPVADVSKASVPPPNQFALFTLATYALSGTDKRRELITRALAFATKAHDEPGTASADDNPQGQPTGFLDGIE